MLRLERRDLVVHLRAVVQVVVVPAGGREGELDAIAAHATGLSFHSGRDWIERALFMIWRAEIVETYMLFVDEPFFQRREQARLSNSRFAGEKHHPPFTRARLSPPVKE